MAQYQFSTIKLVPDLAKNEPVNIGVILYDQSDNKAYPKFTSNWKVVEERTGISRLPNLKQILDITTMNVSDGYLEKLSHKQFQDNLVITEPRIVSVMDSPYETLEKLFESQISIPILDAIEEKKINRFGEWLDKVINTLQFPEQSVQPKYVFKDTAVDRSYPYVFFKKGQPLVGIEYLSFHPSMVNTTKVKSFDIHIIQESQNTYQKTKFKMFSTQSKDEINMEDRQIKKSIEILDISKIPIVYKNDSEYELDRIRHDVLAAA